MLAGLTFILKPLREGIDKEERKSPKKGARQLGAGDGTNTDEFLEKSPPLFLENYIAIFFFKFHAPKASFSGPKSAI